MFHVCVGLHMACITIFLKRKKKKKKEKNEKESVIPLYLKT
jgi:uncharacterized protein (UPF0335 family)